MKILGKLKAVLVITACLLATHSTRAVDGVNAVTFSLTVYNEGDTSQKGTVTTTKLSRIRVTNRDIIQAIGDANDITFTTRAKLLLIRRNLELGDSEPHFVIQDGTETEVDVTEYFSVSTEGEIETGTNDEATGRYRTLIQSILSLSLTVPDIVSFSASGFSNERDGSLRYDGQELPGGITSLLAKLAGSGTATEEEGDQPFLLDGIVKLGKTRLVASAVVE